MARYFLHVRDGTDEILDPEGEEHASIETLTASMLEAARALLSASVRNGVLDFRYRIEAESEDGSVVHILPYRGAIEIIAEAA